MTHNWLVICEVIQSVKSLTGLSGEALRKELKSHYPFTDKAGAKYKTWLYGLNTFCGERKVKPKQGRVK